MPIAMKFPVESQRIRLRKLCSLEQFAQSKTATGRFLKIFRMVFLMERVATPGEFTRFNFNPLPLLPSFISRKDQ